MRAEDLDGVFLTHEHGDHASGVRGLSSTRGLRFFANRATAEAVQRPLSRTPTWMVFESGTPFQHLDITVTPIPVPHDAYDPVGFLFEFGEDTLFSRRTSLAWITDLGYMTQGLSRRLAEVDHLVIEANHNEELVQQDNKRPWSVKQRILGRHGHLSNRAVHDWMAEVTTPRWQQVHLVHLSRDCNSSECIQRDIIEPLNGHLPCPVHIHDPEASSPVSYTL